MSREHIAHYVQDTSKISYGQIKEAGLGERQRIVYDTIRSATQNGVPITDREITRFLGYEDPNTVRPRRFELVSMGLVEEAGKRQCNVSRRRALTWRTPKKLNDYFFSEVGDVLVQTRTLPKDEWFTLRDHMTKRGYRYSGEGRWVKQ